MSEYAEKDHSHLLMFALLLMLCMDLIPSKKIKDMERRIEILERKVCKLVQYQHTVEKEEVREDATDKAEVQ